MKHSHYPKQRISHGDHVHEYRAVEKKKLVQAISVTVIVMLAEIFGGFLTNSMALLSDAGHMFTHSFALFISLGAILFATKGECHHRTFGFYRIEILAALFNSLFLFGVTAWIVYESFHRILNPEPVLSLQMLGFAIVGLIANVISAMLLHGTSKDDLNVRSAFLHMLADTLSSVFIIIGAVVIYFTGWSVIDPILSIGIAIVIFGWGWQLFKDSIKILLEFAPKGMDAEQIMGFLKEEVSEIEEITDLHIWTITSNMYSMTAHVKLKNNVNSVDAKRIVAQMKQLVDEEYQIEHVTIEVA